MVQLERAAMRKKELKQLTLAVPKQETPITNFLTASGTFQDGGLLLNRQGLRFIAHDKENSPSNAQPEDTQFNLADLETMKVIGKGSGGVVQLVRHKWTNKLFALKVIQMNIQETVRKQIVQELKINQASQCPNIVVCYDAFYNNGFISLVLEYMDCGSLADVLKQLKTILEPYLAVVCKQVLKGLVYLHHERHIIHRDIKPSNLLVNHKGEVKITDFGVSAMLANSMGQRDTFVGTYNYMSPERISGSAYGYSSDIWSLGLVILELAIGRFPYLPLEKEEGWLNFYELLETIVGQPFFFYRVNNYWERESANDCQNIYYHKHNIPSFGELSTHGYWCSSCCCFHSVGPPKVSLIGCNGGNCRNLYYSYIILCLQIYKE